MVSTQCLFGLAKDKLLLLLVWYSCLMSVGLLYFAHERVEYTTMVRLVQRGVVDGPFATPQPLSMRIQQEQRKLESNIVKMPRTKAVSFTTPRTSQKLKGYVNVLDGAPLKVQCNQCSVVSSSGQLLNRGAGFDIDQSECIIRMNSAPVRNYEDDVGRRTTIRVIGHVNLGKGMHNDTKLQKELFGDGFERPQIVIIPWLYAEEINKTSDLAYIAAHNLSKEYPDVYFYILTPEKMNLSEAIFTKEVGISRQEAHTWLSTGWMTMLLALDVCDRIDLYGLVEEDHCRKHPNDTTLYHYFEPDFRQECDYYRASEGMLRFGHKFITEKAIFAKWSLTRNIHFHYPSWMAKVDNSTLLDTPFLRTYREALLNGTLEELQSIPKRYWRKKKVVQVIRRKKEILNKTSNANRTGVVVGLSAVNKIEQTAFIALNNSRGKKVIPEKALNNSREIEVIPEKALNNSRKKEVIPEKALNNSRKKEVIPEKALNNSRIKEVIPEKALNNLKKKTKRDPWKDKKTELLKMARKKNIRSKKHSY